MSPNVVVLLFIASSAETDWEEDQDATVGIIWRPSWLEPSPIVILSVLLLGRRRRVKGHLTPILFSVLNLISHTFTLNGE